MDTTTSQKIIIYAIKTNIGYFISDTFNCHYRKSRIPNYTFNEGNSEVSTTYHKDWYFIKEYPSSIQYKISNTINNCRYELKDKTIKSDSYPLVIPYEDKDDYDENILAALYEYKYDKVEPYYADVNYEIIILLELDNFELPPSMGYTAIHKVGFEDRKYTISNMDVNHQLVDKIIFPDFLLSSKPASFTSEQVYNITRQYVIDHIDNSVARLSSNYDFCFKVSKIIPLRHPEVITYQNLMARTKKERNQVHTRIKKYDEFLIFRMTHDLKNMKIIQVYQL